MPKSTKTLLITTQVLGLLAIIMLRFVFPAGAFAPHAPVRSDAAQTDPALTEKIYMPLILREIFSPPTDIVLSNDSLLENQPAGTTVGAFTTTDPDMGNTFTYTLVNGTGSTDNASFQIAGSDLLTGAVFNFEAKNSYSIRVRSTDNTNLYMEKAFTISVTDVNEPPVLANIETSALSFTENGPAAAVTSTLTVTDPDSPQLSGATVVITTNYQSGADGLGFVDQAGITGSFNTATGVLTLTGAASPASYQAALRSVTFVNNSNTPTSATRDITFQVSEGAQTSEALSRLVLVTAVNDAPVNTVPAAQAVNEDTDLVFSAANSNAISIADIDASSSSVKVSLDVAHGTLTLATMDGLTFVDGTSNGQASVHVTGTIASINAALNGLKYRGTQHYNTTRGAEALVVLTSDQGNTGQGGALTDTDTITITVNAVNDPPVAQAKAFTAQTNMKISLSGLLTGATDPDIGDSGYTAVLTVGTVSATTPTGGTVSNINTASGTLDFDPPPGVTGDVTFTYTVCDSGSPAPAACSAPATVTVTVAGPVIWFVDPAATTNGDGRLSSPFKTLAAADAVDAANQRIFIYSGNVPSGITLNTGEWLIGRGATGASFDALFAITPPPGTIARPTIGGSPPSITGTVAMNANSVVRGVDITPNSGATGLSASGALGLAVSQVRVTTNNAAAVSLTNSDGTFSFMTISASGGTNGIVWNNATPAAGSFTVTGTGSLGSGGVIQNMTGHGISLTRASNVSLTMMNIQNIGRSGIDGTGVVNFTFTMGTISTTGTAAAGEHEENGIDFSDSVSFTENNISGTVAITGSTITGARRNAIYIHNYSGTINNLDISFNTLSGGATTASIADAIKVIAAGSASTSANVTTATIQNNTIAGFRFLDASSKYIGGSGIFMSGGSGSLINSTPSTFGVPGTPITISGNTITNMGGNAIAASFNGLAGSSVITINNNGTQAAPINNVEGLGISVLFAGGNSFVGNAFITNNWIDTNGATVRAGSVGIGAQAESFDTSTNNSTLQANFYIIDNRVLHPDGNGIRVYARQSNAIVKARVQNNTVGAPFAANRQGIRIDSGSAAGNTNLCLNLSGNTSVGSGIAQGIGLRKQGSLQGVNIFGINGLVPSPASPAQVSTYIAGLNPAGNGVDILAGDFFVTCSLP